MRLKKMLTMDVVSGEVSDRLNQSLNTAPSRGAVISLRQWASVGYMLSELGHGISETLLEMDRDQVWQGLSRAEKAELLIELLDRTQWKNLQALRKDRRKTNPPRVVTEEPEKKEVPPPVRDETPDDDYDFSV